MLLNVDTQTGVRQFGTHCLELIGRMVPLTSSAFFLVNPYMQHEGAVLYNLSRDADREYRTEFAALDPLNPERFVDSDETVVTLDSRMAPHFLRQTLYYQKFMVPHNQRYVADMFFRRDGRIIAGLSSMREESMGNFSYDELALLDKVHPFLEYTLNTIYLPQRDQERRGISEKHELTERELDVVECVLRGSSNKEIAAQLLLGLPTVKTHLHHIFRKTGARTRSELVARVMLDLSA